MLTLLCRTTTTTSRPRVVVLDTATKQLLVLPVPGFFTFEDVYTHLAHPSSTNDGGVPSREDVFDSWLQATSTATTPTHVQTAVAPTLRRVVECMEAVATGILATVKQACADRGVRVDAMLPLQVCQVSTSILCVLSVCLCVVCACA